MTGREHRGHVQKLSQDLVDRGLLIEAGFLSLREMTLPQDAPAPVIETLRTAFFAGAQHLFGSIMSIMDAGDEASSDDMRRMTAISRELDSFIEVFSAKHKLPRPPGGERA